MFAKGHKRAVLMTADMEGLGSSNDNRELPAADSPQESTEMNPEATEPTNDPVAEQPVANGAHAHEGTEEKAPSPMPDASEASEGVTEPAQSEAPAPTNDDDDEFISASDDDDDDDDDNDDSSDAGETQATEGEATPSKRRRSGYERGEIISVKVLEITETLVTVELDERGDGFTGIIPARELDRMSADMVEMLEVGKDIDLFVVNNGDSNGNVKLSLNRALEELDWTRAEEFRQSREIYEGFIGGYNKGGLIVRFGRLRGFIPQSQISDERRARVDGDTPEARWGSMIREPITVKVIEVDRGRNRLILSERAAMRETREARKARLIEELAVNEVRTGRVVSLEDFGAFVDVGGAEGLVHVTELSWGHVTHPRQVLDVGQEITVEVISIDPKRKRIGLSLKRQLPDPWDVVASDYQQGQLVKAQITKLTKFGAFAQLVKQPEVEGLVHISELSENRVAHPREVVDVGEELTLRIVKIDVADRRLGLSLKAVNSTEYLDSDMDFLFDE